MGRKRRRANQPRDIRITRRFTGAAAGSVLYEAGRTRVLCAASVERGVPPWLAGRGRGWMTAEYRMLPSSTRPRKPRDSARGRIDGRNTEIQRLIGRSMRSVTDLNALGERTVWLDCDVLEADGGTRTAAITAGYVATALALHNLGLANVLRDQIAAISIGHVDGEILVDLDYSEDSTARVDMNVVATRDGHLVEVQSTAEGVPITRAEFDRMLDAALRSIKSLCETQEQALRQAGADLGVLMKRRT